ncbi:PREDICTED: ubiquitin carboxyl-terminal hydrolase 47-like [Priapulus caudatus]|uniref:Ubiquitin carboxyl-terminal hydrolase 47 n=1 Tax=Priapulus caudatus TaxID=37621 RepID=A0ABM1EU21_PRICU|nr:PREDICTED: ubiquitin carboxyl-terminal hydrolase 47-like [Priapulus caudatus]
MVPVDKSQVSPMEESKGGEEAKALCIVRDMTNPHWQTSKITLNLSLSTPLKDLVSETAKEFKYVPDSFLLIYNLPGWTGEVELSPSMDLSLHLSDIGVVVESEPGIIRRNNFTLMETKIGKPPKKIGKISGNILFNNLGYVGLVNQAMTCYLNSLIQTLYMTPEFRNALYKWEYRGSSEDDEPKSIPFQLQKLFLNLQTSKKRAVETTDLTRSFGWDSSEAWQQHDVQELCRVMFDALETNFKNTDQADLINQLYQGQLKDYVRCLDCGSESARTDAFLDIPLTIRPFGATTVFKSVGEALQAFVEPETLDGTNQYFCEQCNKKCDAHKGLEFVKYPYMLTLQLKRFDFDYSTMHRIKLNEKVTFPEILNLNKYVNIEEPLSPTKECPGNFDIGAPTAGENNHDCDANTVAFVTPNGPTENAQLISNSVETSNKPVEAKTGILVDVSSDTSNNKSVKENGVDEGVELSDSGGPEGGADVKQTTEETLTNDKNAEHMKEEGPWVYELFSIMIHSGSAAGGHYYAYIKSFTDGQWYCFNDQSVQKITYDDIRKTYGGGAGRASYTSTYTSSTNAYMLMYRQIDKSRNSEPMQLDTFPQHLATLLKRISDDCDEYEKQQEANLNTCRLKVFCQHPMEGKMVDKKLHIHADDTLQDATDRAYKLLDLEGVVTRDQCRLLKYDEYHDNIEESFQQKEGATEQEEEERTMSDYLGGVKSSYKFDLMMEIRRPDQKFQVYEPGGISVKLHIVDLVSETIQPPFNLRAQSSNTLDEFKAIISEVTGLPTNPMRLVLEKYSGELRYLHDPENINSLRGLGFFRSEKVYVDCSGVEDSPNFEESRLHKLLDEFGNTIRITIVLPPASECDELMQTLQSLGFLDDNPALDRCTPAPSTPPAAPPCSSSTLVPSPADSSHDAILYASSPSPVPAATDVKHETQSIDSGVASDASLIAGGVAAAADGSSSRESGGEASSSSCSSSARSSSKTSESPGTDTPTLTETVATPTSTAESSPGNSTAEAVLTPGNHAAESDVTPGSSPKKIKKTKREKEAEATSESAATVAPPAAADIAGGDGKHVGKQDVAAATSDDAALPGAQTHHNTNNNNDAKPPPAAAAKKTKDAAALNGTMVPSPTTSPKKTVKKLVKKKKSGDSTEKKGEAAKKVTTVAAAAADNGKSGTDPAPEKSLVANDDTSDASRDRSASSSSSCEKKNRRPSVDDKKTDKRTDKKTDDKKTDDKRTDNKKTDKRTDNKRMDDKKTDDKKTDDKKTDDKRTDNKRMDDKKTDDKRTDDKKTDDKRTEDKTTEGQLAVYVRQWCPSEFKMKSFQEVVLDSFAVEELKAKISDLSGIAACDVSYAKSRGTFPCDISLLDVDTEMEWNPDTQQLNYWPLFISDDGAVIYYKTDDKKTDDKRTEDKTTDDKKTDDKRTDDRRTDKKADEGKAGRPRMTTAEAMAVVKSGDSFMKSPGTVTKTASSLLSRIRKFSGASATEDAARVVTASWKQKQQEEGATAAPAGSPKLPTGKSSCGKTEKRDGKAGKDPGKPGLPPRPSERKKSSDLESKGKTLSGGKTEGAGAESSKDVAAATVTTKTDVKRKVAGASPDRQKRSLPKLEAPLGGKDKKISSNAQQSEDKTTQSKPPAAPPVDASRVGASAELSTSVGDAAESRKTESGKTPDNSSADSGTPKKKVVKKKKVKTAEEDSSPGLPEFAAAATVSSSPKKKVIKKKKPKTSEATEAVATTTMTDASPPQSSVAEQGANAAPPAAPSPTASESAAATQRDSVVVAPAGKPAGEPSGGAAAPEKAVATPAEHSPSGRLEQTRAEAEAPVASESRGAPSLSETARGTPSLSETARGAPSLPSALLSDIHAGGVLRPCHQETPRCESPGASSPDAAANSSADSLKPESPSQDSMKDLSSPEPPVEEEARGDVTAAGNVPPSVSALSDGEHDEACRRYFYGDENVNTLTGQRVLTVYVDKRITIAGLKQKLEPYVKCPMDHFKVFRVYSNGQEFECSRYQETLVSYSDDSKLSIKLGRALKKGEYKVKVYQLGPATTADGCKFLIDTIFAKGMTVLDSKKLILPEIKTQCALEIPLNRCRLRKKNWKNPGSVYLDWQKYEEHIPIFSNWDVFVELLSGPEKLVSEGQLACV